MFCYSELPSSNMSMLVYVEVAGKEFEIKPCRCIFKSKIRKITLFHKRVSIVMYSSATGWHVDIHILPTSTPGNLLWPQFCPGKQPTASGAQKDKSDGRYQGPYLWNQVLIQTNHCIKQELLAVKLFTLCSWVIIIIAVGMLIRGMRCRKITANKINFEHLTG